MSDGILEIGPLQRVSRQLAVLDGHLDVIHGRQDLVTKQAKVPPNEPGAHLEGQVGLGRTGTISIGSRVVVDRLLHSHATTRSAGDLVGRMGIVIRLVDRGGLTYALVDMDDGESRIRAQRRWSFQTDDLSVIADPAPSRSVSEPILHTIGLSLEQADGEPLKWLRHAVEVFEARAKLTTAVCGVMVKPIDTPACLISFDPEAPAACADCRRGLDTRQAVGRSGSSAGL